MFANGHSSPTPLFGRVVILASLGGLQAITTVLAGLPADYTIPVTVMQHRRRTSEKRDSLAAILEHRTCLPIRIAEHGAEADRCGVTVIPPQTAATIDESGSWALSDGTTAMRPGDALLTSSARATPTIAVILTGSLGDGAEGCRAVKLGGGRVLVQDPAHARASGMPANAIATGCADFVLPVDRLASALLALTTAPGAAELLAVPLPPWARLSS
ncbi:chemotaxis protein CheB [Mycobacterium fragae]|uniref:protein-glutamate methylesterase n=1 Tax=Mycobacterium fragae TaxID=1260918 RepID=A0A1X1V315_9MYCO|nr:chemotaxis protein CheB [Mycobacterium fragae]MCV7399747.1 chemotaxis protein CheB [Mycobacterium fragae]ORV63484.1 chemotaxis protein CheB [Mycobacterium fragae]